MITITYHSKRADRNITRESVDYEMAYGTHGGEDVPTLRIVRSNGKQVLADLQNNNVQTKKDEFDSWTFVGELVGVGGTVRIYCDTCGEVDANLSLPSHSGDTLHATCPDCNGVYEGWTE